jgi:hypothetical protein
MLPAVVELDGHIGGCLGIVSARPTSIKRPETPVS